MDYHIKAKRGMSPDRISALNSNFSSLSSFGRTWLRRGRACLPRLPLEPIMLFFFLKLSLRFSHESNQNWGKRESFSSCPPPIHTQNSSPNIILSGEKLLIFIFSRTMWGIAPSTEPRTRLQRAACAEDPRSLGTQTRARTWELPLHGSLPKPCQLNSCQLD